MEQCEPSTYLVGGRRTEAHNSGCRKAFEMGRGWARAAATGTAAGDLRFVLCC